MNRKFIAFLTAMSVIGSVSLPVYADNETEPEVMTVYYDQNESTEADTAEEAAPADAVSDTEVSQTEEPADAEAAQPVQPETEDTPAYEATEDSAAAEEADETESSDAVQYAAAETENDTVVTRTIVREVGGTEDEVGTYEYETVNVSVEDESGLTEDEAEYKAASWYEWDKESGTLTLKGQLPFTRWDANDTDNEVHGLAYYSGIKYTDIKSVVVTPGTKASTSTSEMFRGMKNLRAIHCLSNLDTSNVVTMTGMFIDCDSLTSIDLSGCDLRKVQKMNGMFNGCNNLETINLVGCDTSSLRLTRLMFANCPSLKTIKVNDKWNMANVATSENMFKGATSLVGGNGTKFNSDIIDVTYARPDLGSSQPGYLTSSVYTMPVFTTPKISIKPVFGGKVVTFDGNGADVEVYFNYGSSNITTSSHKTWTGDENFVQGALSGKYAAMYYRAYRNGSWTGLGKWGLLNVQLDAPQIVQSGPKSKNDFKIYSQAKNSYIVYTLDGSLPTIDEGSQKLTVTNGKLVWGTSAVVNVPKGKTVNAIVIRCGLVTSPVMTYKNSED